MTDENVNYTNENGWTLFDAAMKFGHNTTVDYLRNKLGDGLKFAQSSVNVAVSRGQTDLVCSLILLQIKQNNIHSMTQLKKSKFFNKKIVETWLSPNHLSCPRNSGLYSFLTRLNEVGLKKDKQLNYIISMLSQSQQDATNETQNEVNQLYDKMRHGMCVM